MRPLESIRLSLFFFMLLAVAAVACDRPQKASEFLADFASLPFGKPAGEAAVALKEKYVTLLETDKTSGDCRTGDCRLAFAIYGKSTGKRSAGILAYVRLIDGRVAYREVLMYLGNGVNRSEAVTSEREARWPGRDADFHVSRAISGGPWRVSVRLTPQASDEQHRIAYAYNTKCLSDEAVCKDVRDLLPTIIWDPEP